MVVFNRPRLCTAALSSSNQWIWRHTVYAKTSMCTILTLLLFSLKSSSISSALSSSDTSPSSASADRYAGRRFPCRETRGREGDERAAPTWRLTHICFLKLSCTRRLTQPAPQKCSDEKHRTQDTNAQLTVEKWPFSSVLDSKAVATGNTHTLDVRNNTRAAADSQRSSQSSPFSGGSPLVSRCEGVSGSEDFLSFFQNQWWSPCRTWTRSPTQLWDVTRFVCRCCHKFPPHFICPFLSPSTVFIPPFCPVRSRDSPGTFGGERWMGLTGGREGEKRAGEDS